MSDEIKNKIREAINQVDITVAEKNDWLDDLDYLDDQTLTQIWESLQQILITQGKYRETLKDILRSEQMVPTTELTREQVAELTIDNLKQPDMPVKVINYIESADFNNDSYLASRLAAKLQALIKDSVRDSGLDEEQWRFYHNYIYLADFIALSQLNDQQVAELFRSKLLLAYHFGIDPMAKVNNYFVIFDSPEICSRFARLVMKALRLNTERIGEAGLQFQEQELRPEIGNWLKIYLYFCPEGIARSAIERTKFLGDANVARLSAADRDLLFKIIQLYDFLEFPNKNTQFIKTINREEDRAEIAPEAETETAVSPVRPSFSKETITEPAAPVIPAAKPISQPPAAPQPQYSQAEILKKYQGDPAEWQAVQSQVSEINAAANHDFKTIADGFYTLTQDSAADKLKILAYLYLLAGEEKLDALLNKDDRFYRLVEDSLKRSKEPQLLNDFKMYPTAPQFIRLFLELILQGQLKLSENEAARVALRLGNFLKQRGNDKYSQLAYFDLAVGEFRWKK